MPRSAASETVSRRCPALAQLAEHIGDAQVRNRGTIGGSVANNDPAADYPAAVLGLNATVHTNQRTIAADDFFTGMFETALGEGEIITEVRFPKPDRAGYIKFPNPASRYAIVGVMVAQTGGETRVAVTGAAPCVFRAGGPRERARRQFLAGRARWPERQRRRPQQRHPRERRIPGASGRGHGQARGRGGELKPSARRVRWGGAIRLPSSFSTGVGLAGARRRL